MASQIEFTLSGDQAAARAIVMSSVASTGFTAEPTGEWSYRLTRGNKTKSLWLGGAAGKDFFLTYLLDFSADSTGGFVARLSRDSVSSAIRGGAIGAAKASNEFQALADVVGASTTQAGIFAAVRSL